MATDRSAWRLLPSEEVLWEGGPADVPRERMWVFIPLFFFAVSIVTLLFARLLVVAELPGMRNAIALAALLAAAGIAGVLAPRWLFGDLRYLVTDRRVLVRRGRFVRSMERRKLSYARIRWHRSVPVVGHLELVVAVPFGPLARRLRLMLRDVREPDRLLAVVRGETATDAAGDFTVPLAERLDADEPVLWGGHPQGAHLGWREIATTVLGVLVTGVGVSYGYRNVSLLLDLEGLGLPVRSAAWALLFSAVLISWVCMLTIGLGLVWRGVIRARRLGADTEYLLTDRRVLIRRGTTELSVERGRIVDVATQPAPGGLAHLFLVLDAPHSRALEDSGALKPFLPSRDPVPPVLFELPDAAGVREQILHA
ncbi:MAG: hypothetical protein KF901_22325 [Myxococcales bacterium]|nr:hypothetical protein [Myxococcales bacterium]